MTLKKNKVQVVITTGDSNIEFLILQMNERRKFYWQNITGSVEDGESLLCAALREASEETGMDQNLIKRITKLKLGFEFKDQWGNNVEETCYHIHMQEKWDIILDASEHVNFKWINGKQVQRGSVYYESNYTALLEVLNET